MTPPETSPPTRVLLVEDNRGDQRLVEIALESSSGAYEVSTASSLEEGLALIGAQTFHVLLLDLNLPDSHGMETFQRTAAIAPPTPLAVLPGSSDEEIAVEAVQAGAQDYLVKGEAALSMLPRVISYAIERHRLQEQLRDWSLFDELTGLFNRRGFLTLAEQQRRLSARTHVPWLVFFIDMDRFKKINDRFGHDEGDRALVAVAEILRRAFRTSDIIARIGGDEFVVCAIGAGEEALSHLCGRVREELEEHNAQRDGGASLSLSIGTAIVEATMGVEEALERADRNMYEAKQVAHRSDRPGVLRRDDTGEVNECGKAPRAA